MYRPDGDRKFISQKVEEVAVYMQKKHKLTESQKSELINFGVTQDERYSIKSFVSK